MFIYRGKLRDLDDLPKGNLPENAVKFVEPEDEVELNKKAARFILPVLVLIILIVAVSIFWGTNNYIFPGIFGALIAFLLGALSIPVHELLHGICFPKEAEVEFFYYRMLFATYSTYPVSKLRFIMLSLCPQIILGWLPLVIWVIVPMSENVGGIIFIFGVLSVLFGVGDDLNVFNAIRQMPKGSVQQLSGFNSYWFIPDKK